MFGLRWSEWNSKGQLAFKSRDFATDKARAAFIEKLTNNDKLFEIQAYSDPAGEN